MNKNLINFIVTIIVALILSQFLPWWSIMVAAFVTSMFFSLERMAVFVTPFMAIALFWMVYAFWLGFSNDFIMSGKIALLFPLQGHAYLLILVTGIIGGASAGIAALLGKQCSILVNRKGSNYRN